MEINNKNDANSLRDGSNSDFANTGVIRFARPIRYAPLPLHVVCNEVEPFFTEW